jgi:hypothetical protein
MITGKGKAGGHMFVKIRHAGNKCERTNALIGLSGAGRFG